MRFLYFVSMFLHLTSAILWIGGMLFLALMIVPALRDPDLKSAAGKLVYVLGIRFRAWGWGALATFIITGTFNLSYRFQSWTALFDRATWSGYWGTTLAIKLSLFTLILIISAVHDFYLGPRATRLMRDQPQAPETLRFRQAASWMGRMNLLLAGLILFLAIILVRGLPW